MLPASPLPSVARSMLALALCCTWFVGCDDPASTAPSGASQGATSQASAPSAKPKPTMEPVKKPSPLNLGALKKSLKCAGKTGSGPCPVLEKFDTCKTGWSPITQSGDGRWLGKGAVVSNGKFIEEFTIMRARRVPLAEVAPGAMGVKIAIIQLPDDRPGLKPAAAKAFGALSRGDVAKVGNHAIEYLKERQDWPEAYAQQADDNQIFVATGAGAYLCASVTSQALFAVRLSGSREHPADGIYATLYPTQW